MGKPPAREVRYVLASVASIDYDRTHLNRYVVFTNGFNLCLPTGSMPIETDFGDVVRTGSDVTIRFERRRGERGFTFKGLGRIAKDWLGNEFQISTGRWSAPGARDKVLDERV